MNPQHRQGVLFKDPSEDFQQTEPEAEPKVPWRAPRKPTKAVNLKPVGGKTAQNVKTKISARQQPLKPPTKHTKLVEEIKEPAEKEEIKPPPEEKQAIVKRAKGRAKVPDKFSEGVRRFFFSPTGILKILRMGYIIGALACFLDAQAVESYIAVTVLEVGIVLFFILTYMLTLQHLMTYLHWPLLDCINSIISSVFLLVVASFAMQEKNRRHLFYVGGSLCLTAAIVCGIDACVVTQMMRNNMKRFLGVKTKR
ncbi:CKLF-like MARVEL transmembrane domain-containing protein 1 [Otolemur garnettii]|uniref:CKLF-like MARVEL transmembrane domain-containing protein 1 n=1 Tax=Otolemur garnettii TaxID=30611 RepID=UPI000274234F|nr:CKLF-like MARVEL transmembrane domain-containing protein 1 [Otolemur garnettii]